MAVSATMRDAHVVGIQKLSSDEWATSTGASSTTSSAFQDKIALTFTPSAAGDYFVLATAECRHDTASHRMECQLDHGGTAIGVWQMTPASAGEYRTWAVLVKLAALSGPQTIRLQFRRVTAVGTSYMRHARLWAFRGDTFRNVGYAENATTQTQTATTMTDALVLTYPVATAGDHLLIAAAHVTGPNDYAIRGTHALLVDGVTKATDSLRRHTAVLTNDMASFLYAEVVNFSTTGHKTIKFQQRRTDTGVGVSSVFTRQAIVALELPVAGPARVVSLGQVFLSDRVAYSG